MHGFKSMLEYIKTAEKMAATETTLGEIERANNIFLKFIPQPGTISVIQEKDHFATLEKLAGPLLTLATTDSILTKEQKETLDKEREAIKIIDSLASMTSMTRGNDLVDFMRTPGLNIAIPGINLPFPDNFQALANLALANITDKIPPEERQTWLLKLTETGGFTMIKSSLQALIQAKELNASEWAEAMSQRLTYWALDGKLNEVQCLRAAGANPSASLSAINDNGLTALMEAAFAKNTRRVQALLAAGANPNVQDKDGDTTLMLVAVSLSNDAYADMAKALLKAGAKINLPNNTGMTALMYATRSGDTNGVQALLAAGADPNLQSTIYRMTALMQAAISNNTNVAQALLAAGADTKLKDHKGRTALDLAGEEVKAILTAHAGATTPPAAATTASAFHAAATTGGAASSTGSKKPEKGCVIM
jgi:hypothetical protein